MQTLLDLIMAHYNRVASMLAAPGEYFPVMDEDQRNGDILWEFWLMGYLAAMRLRPDAWKVIERRGTAQAKKALTILDMLGRIAIRFSEGKPGKRDRLGPDAPELISGLVEDLNRFAKSQVPSLPYGAPLAANIGTAPIDHKKLGRNDPCSCGSGKKFKKCCMADGARVH